MREVMLDQRSPAWLAWRKSGITATESAVILNLHPEKTPWRLWMEKTDRAAPPDLSVIPAVRFGVENEPVARRLFEVTHQTVVMPACGEWESNPLFRASFDGLTFDGVPVEIKCPQEETLKDVRTNGRDSAAYRLYYVQVQHQIMVSDAYYGWLVFLDGDHLIEFDIPRDDKLIREIQVKGRVFWDYVTKDKEPTKDPERDFYAPRTEEAVAAWAAPAKELSGVLEEIESAKAVLKTLQERKEALTQTLVGQMGNYRLANFAGVALTRRAAKSSVNLAEFLKAHNLTEKDLDPYRTQSGESWSVRRTKGILPEGFTPSEGVARALEEATLVDPSAMDINW